MREERVLEFAWQVHTALRDWTGKVDTKASFALTLESVALGIIISWSGPDGPLGSLVGWALGRYRFGVACFVTAVLAAAVAVFPRTRWWSARSEWATNYVYFGHLRYWDADELVATWRRDEPLRVLAHQHIVMAKIAWQKHVLLQLSLVLAFCGGALIASAL